MSPNTSHPRQVVTAVIVAHDGARLLPGLIQAMRDQTRPVDRAVGVDTGSRDRSGALLAELLGADAVFGMDPGTGYGEAVSRALQHPAARRAVGVYDGPATEWIWLLHDDCQPAPDALEHLLRLASRYQTTAVLGPKLRDLADRRVLREAGLTFDRAGRRLSGIEPGEIDQGQHDGNRPVLAVSSAGMLIRRDVWDQLGGFDPLLPLFRDDIDFCWRVHAAGHDVRVVTDAVVYHRELSGRHRRRPGIAAAGHPRLLDRRSALYVFVVNLPLVPMLTVVGGCLIGSLLRATYFLLTKQQRRAFGHLGALAWLLRHPLQVRRSRRRRSSGRKRAYAVLRPQLPHGKTLSRMAESVVGVLSRTSPYEGSGEHGGASDDPDDDLPLPPPDSVLRRVLTNPGVLMFAGLAVITAVAERSLIGDLFRGSGTLSGGALVPAWGGASDLWREYLAGYHATGVGSAASAPPYVAVVAAVATLLGGKPWLAVDVLLLGAAPIAGIMAFLAARRVTPALAARIWIGVTYALLPVATGAVAAGRLGSAVAFMLLPAIGSTIGRMFTCPPRPARRAAWAAGLLVGVAAAFVPLLWLIAVAGAVGVVGMVAVSRWRSGARPRALPGAGPRGWALAVNAGIVAVVPAAVLVPWTFHLLASPSSMLLEAGIQRPGLPVLRPQPLLLLSPGGPGLPPPWVTGGLIFAACCALLSGRRRVLVLTGWGVALAGLAVAVVVSRLRVTSPVTGGAVTAWPGLALAIAAGGLLLAATPMFEWAAGTAWGVAASRASLATRARLVGRRGTVALAVGAVAMTGPILAAGYWLATGVRGPLSTAGTPVLPPFVAASAAAQGQVRTLVLRREQGMLTYEVLRNSDPVLGEPELAEASVATQTLSTAVASLAATDSGDSVNAAQALSQFAIGYVLLPAPVDQVLAAQLDGVAGLQPLTVSSAYDLWRVAQAAARVRVVTAAGTVIDVASGVVGGRSVVAPATAGTLVLAEPAGGWSASLNGRPLRALSAPAGGWAQGFVLPAGGGRLVIARDNLARDLALGAEAAAALVAFLLAMPGTRPASSAELTGSAPPEIAPAPPAPPAPGSADLEPVRSAAPAPRPIPAAPSAPFEPPGPLAPSGPFAPAAMPVPAAQAAAPAAMPVPAAQAAASAPTAQAATSASRRRGGSHRAARHGKPSARGWRGKASSTRALAAQPPEQYAQAMETPAPSTPAPPSAASPAERAGSAVPSGPWPQEASWTPAEPREELWARAEPREEPWAPAEPSSPLPEQSGSRPPWELGEMP